MLESERNIIALIPARGGSKGVKNKNIRELNGKPLIQYTVEAALNCKSINRVIVSTNDKEIATIAKNLGADVPFLRPEEIATDNTPDRPVMTHLVNWLMENEGFSPSFLVYLRPTTPFKTSKLIDSCIKKIIANKEATSLRTVTKAEGVYHPYWMYKSEEGALKSFIEGISIKDYYQRQLLPDCYRLNGVVDILKPEIFMKNEDIYGNNIFHFETNEEQSLDIDTEFDFQLAEFLFSKS